jgi:hypothetical protein
MALIENNAAKHLEEKYDAKLLAEKEGRLNDV